MPVVAFLQWQKLGALTPAAENVTDTARLAGRATPLTVAATTVRYHDPASAACARLRKRRQFGKLRTVGADRPINPYGRG